jgi:hypothetical protein
MIKDVSMLFSGAAPSAQTRRYRDRRSIPLIGTDVSVPLPVTNVSIPLTVTDVSVPLAVTAENRLHGYHRTRLFGYSSWTTSLA